MNVLIIGGTGLISTGIVKHLLARGADVTMYNRGKRENTLPEGVKELHGDRNQFDAFEKQMQALPRFDVVIDMIAFNPEQSQSVVRAFAKRTEQVIFCSTVCTYGVKVPPGVLVDETFPQEPISGYGRNKVACEKLLNEAHARDDFAVTVIRPSCTYGQGNPLIDVLDGDPVTWSRVRAGLPVICTGDGLGLWVATHRDDVGKLFAHAAQNRATYGQSYNATRDQQFTWRDFYRQAAQALGKPANVLFLPTGWVLKQDATKYGLLREITQFHGAYSSEKAKRDVPEFRCEIDFVDGARRTFDDLDRRNAWKDPQADPLYNRMVQQALDGGLTPETL